MEKIQLISKLSVIEPERGYWFIRTDNGVNFEPFTENGFIGIGWNPITLEDITKLSAIEVQQKIAKTYNIDLELAKGKSKVTSIYNKLIRFKDLKKGDVIIVPSNSSGRLAFGIVEDTNVYIDIEKSHDCEYYKRKKVNWITTKSLGELDPIFYEIKISRHAISNIKHYEDYIDRIMSTFYFKDNFGNFVFDVNQDEDINLIELVDLISSIQKLLHNINDFYQFDEKVDECVIKLTGIGV
jgi:restriction system protein